MAISNPRPAFALAGLSLLTAGIHAAVVGDHLREFPPFGIFFSVTAVAELAMLSVLGSGSLRRGSRAGAQAGSTSTDVDRPQSVSSVPVQRGYRMA